MGSLTTNADVFIFDGDTTTSYLSAKPYRDTTYFQSDHLSKKRQSQLPKNFQKYKKTIDKYAKKHRIKPALLYALIEVESLYDKDIVSSKGAVGLMQLMPLTGERFGVDRNDRTIADKNIAAGTQYLRILLDMFKDTRLALAAYNSGEGSVIKYNGIPPYKETQNYVKEVLRLQEKKYTMKKKSTNSGLIYDAS